MPIERTIEVVNKLGLHARAAANLVKTASSFESEVTIEHHGQAVNAKSIMGIMMLAAACGSTITIRVEGADAAPACEAIEQLFRERFGEDE